MSKIDFSFFVEERIIGKGGFGTVYAVRKKYGTPEENLVFYAAKELDKYKIIKVKGLAEMTMNELGFMIEISEGKAQLIKISFVFSSSFTLFNTHPPFFRYQVSRVKVLSS